MKRLYILCLLFLFPFTVQSTTIYSNNFEVNNGGLIQVGCRNFAWEWGIPKYVGPTNAHSGQRCWGTVIEGNYYTTSNREYLIITNLTLTSATNANLEFWHYYEFCSMGDDAGHVQVSTNGGTDWILLGDYPYEYPFSSIWMLDSGPGYAYKTGTNWNKASFDLTTYIGKTIDIRFRFEANNWNNNNPGWYIDDIVIRTEPLNISGTGNFSNAPYKAYSNSTNTFDFYFVATKSIYDGKVTLDIPTSWTTPQNAGSASLGFIQVRNEVGSSVVNTNVSIASRKITIEITNMQAGNTIRITYGAGLGAVVPSTLQEYSFILSSGRDSQGITPLTSAPWVVVQPRIIPPYTDNFESGSGGLYISGNKQQWEYGTPSAVGPSSAHSGSYCWGTKISANYDLSAWQERVFLPPIDLTGITTNVYMGIWHWHDLFFHPNDMHAGVILFISTDGGTNYTELHPKYGTRYNDDSMSTPFFPSFTPENWSKKSPAWEKISIDLSDFTNDTVHFYYEFAESGAISPRPGYYFDDLEVLLGKPPVAGSGECEITPTATYASSTDYYRITYTAQTRIYDGEVRIDVPSGWTAPQATIQGNPGYVFITYTNSDDHIKTTPNIAGQLITVTVSNMYAGHNFIVTYSNATAQATYGPAAFTVQSRRLGETFVNINIQPEVRVMPLIASYPWNNNFESSDGGLVPINNPTPFWQWGTPTAGPSSANSGSKCWGTLIGGSISSDYNKYRLYTPFFNLGSITNAIIDFYYYTDLPNAWGFGAQLWISTNQGHDFKLFGQYPTDYDYQNFNSDPPDYFNEDGWAASTTGWEQKVMDLSSYKGNIVQFMYQFVTKGSFMNYPGFYMDDLSIIRNRPPIAGSGTATITPNVTDPSSTKDYHFTFTSEKNFYTGFVTFLVPSDWTTPQKTVPGNPGYTMIRTTLSNAIVNNDVSISGTGPWTIQVTVTNIPAQGGFILAYSNATAPSSIGQSTFNVETALDTETLTEIQNSPVVVRLNTIVAPFTHNFDSASGGWVEAGSTHNLWDWGTPSWGPSSAHSGARVWGTVLNDNYAQSGVLDKLTSPIIDITGAAQAHLAFYHWYRFGDAAMGDAAGNIMISTNFIDFHVLGANPKNYPSSWAFSWSGEKYGQDGYSYMDWGTQGKWEKRTFNLLDYVGKKIIVRFDFGSSSYASGNFDYPGWYIDDVSVLDTPPPIAGTGQASVYPESAIVGSSNNYTFTFTAKEDIADGTIQIVFPSGWTKPHTNSSSASRVYLEIGNGSFNYTLISNGNKLNINVQGFDYGEEFRIKYVKAYAPSSQGTFTFTNRSKGAAESFADLDESPSIVVQEIQYLPYEEDFESDNGGWIADGGQKIFEWGTPANVGPSSAHSGSYCWGTRLNGNYMVNNAWENITTPPIDVTLETQVYLSFYHYYDTEADAMKNYPWGSGDGGYLEIASADSLEALSSASFQKIGYYPNDYNQSLNSEEFWGGNSSDWIEQGMNLSAYKGKYIKLRFYFITDWDYGDLPGWYIDDISINNILPKDPDVAFTPVTFGDSSAGGGGGSSGDSYGVTFLDFDKDGDFDVIENSYNQNNNIIWKNDGTGNLSSYKSVGKNSTCIMKFADLNNDGYADAFAGNCKGDIGSLAEQPNEVFFNNSGKEFQLQTTLGNDITRDVALTDIDNDGDVDIFVANVGANSIFVNDGNGEFQESETLLPGDETTAVAFWDFNNDGYMDAVLGNRNGEANRLLYNKAGTFNDASMSLGKYDTTAIDIGDIDMDGDMDIVFGTTTLIKIWTNSGDNTFGFVGDSRFQARNDTYYTNEVQDLRLADIDNDGDLDIIAAAYSGHDMIWLNTGLGSFKDSNNQMNVPVSKHMTVGDFNKDGFLDFAFGKYEQLNYLWLNDMTNNNINDSPSVPNSLSVTFDENDAVVTWTPGSDSETPTHLLTYNLNIGTTPDGSDILSIPQKKDNYYYTQLGNVGPGVTSGSSRTWRIRNLTKISYYYFSIQTVDRGLKGSTWKTVNYYHDPKKPPKDDFKVSDNFMNLNDDEESIITYNLGEASKVTIEIVNLEGTIVKTILKDAQKPAGYDPYIHKEVWKGKNEATSKIAPGLYWVFVKTDHWTKKKRVLIVW